MAYGAGDYLLTIRGDLAGGEVWANTWAVKGTGAVQDVADAFHTFYTSWAGVCANKWKATGAAIKELQTGGDTTELSWALITGERITAPLPSEVAARFTVDTGGHNGGPFLCGMDVGCLNADGQFDTVDLVGVLDALDTLVNTDLPAAEFVLGLNSPTDSLVYVATRVRVGHIFDVIRRRRNKLSEGYTIVDVAQPAVGVRSRRLFGPRYIGGTAGAWQTMYTVPSGRTLVIRHLYAWDRNGGGATVGWRINASGLPAEPFYELAALPAGGHRAWTDWVALNPGDLLQCTGNSTTSVVSGFGALLLGEPEQMPLACAAGEWAAAIVTIVAGIGAGSVVIIHALRRDPPYRAGDG